MGLNAHQRTGKHNTTSSYHPAYQTLKQKDREMDIGIENPLPIGRLQRLERIPTGQTRIEHDSLQGELMGF